MASTSTIIANPRKPKLLASVVCPGGQGDVSVHGNLLVHVGRADARPRRLRHGGRGAAGQRRALPRRPHLRHHRREEAEAGRRRADVPRLAHAHARHEPERQSERLHLRIGHRHRAVRPRSWPAAPALDPKDDPNTALFSIDVIQVPLAAPEKARIVSRPRIFADPATGAISGLWPGGDHGPGTQKTRVTNQCHDITVFPEIGLAAGACSGNGILLDISRSGEARRASTTSWTRTSPTGTRRPSTTTARR